MEKKLIIALLLFVGFNSARAQIEKGRVFVGAGSVSGISSDHRSDFGDSKVGFNLTGGYFLSDNLMLGSNVSIGLEGLLIFREAAVSFGPFGRYYHNNLFAGVGFSFASAPYSDTTLRAEEVSVEIGYALFINDNISLEPTLSYATGSTLTNSSRLSALVGLGIYLP